MSTTQEKMLDWERFGKYVSAMRKKLGMSQMVFAERISRKQADVSKIERGKTQVTVETIFRIAEALQLKPETLFSKFQKK